MAAATTSLASKLGDISELLEVCVQQLGSFAPSIISSSTATRQLVGTLGPAREGSMLADDVRLLIDAAHACGVHGRMLLRIEDALVRHAEIAQRLDPERLERYAKRLAKHVAPLATEMGEVADAHTQLAERWQQLDLATPQGEQARALFTQLVSEAAQMRTALGAYANELVVAATHGILSAPAVALDVPDTEEVPEAALGGELNPEGMAKPVLEPIVGADGIDDAPGGHGSSRDLATP